MSIGWLLLWLVFLVYVSFRAARYYAQKRFGIAIALSFLALFVAYEVTVQWYGPRPSPPAPAQTSAPASASPEAPAAEGEGQGSPPSWPVIGPPPATQPAE